MSTTPDNKYGIDDALKQEEQEHPARAAMSRRTFAKVAGVSAAALAIGGSWALAWFTGRDTKVNKVSIANGLNVRVVEPAWVPENAVHVVAGQHLPKDPRIENLSDEFAGWMVVEIRVPTAVVSVFDEAEQKVLDPVRTPLFSFTADPRWTALEQFEDGDTDVYRYGWPQTIPALGQTPPIFEEVIVANLAEAQGQSGEKIITATAYGIQEEALPDIKTAWEAYKKQNGIGDGEADKRIVSAVTAGTLLKFVEGVPEVGDDVDGKTIEEVVPDIEHLETQDTTPLTSTPEAITYVDGTTPTAPDNTVNWFKDMSKVEEIDIFGIAVTEETPIEGMFEGTDSLVKVRVRDESPIVLRLPENFEQTSVGGIYELDREPWNNKEKFDVKSIALTSFGILNVSLVNKVSAAKSFTLDIDVETEEGNCLFEGTKQTSIAAQDKSQTKTYDVGSCVGGGVSLSSAIANWSNAHKGKVILNLLDSSGQTLSVKEIGLLENMWLSAASIEFDAGSLTNADESQANHYFINYPWSGIRWKHRYYMSCNGIGKSKEEYVSLTNSEIDIYCETLNASLGILDTSETKLIAELTETMNTKFMPKSRNGFYNSGIKLPTVDGSNIEFIYKRSVYQKDTVFVLYDSDQVGNLPEHNGKKITSIGAYARSRNLLIN